MAQPVFHPQPPLFVLNPAAHNPVYNPPLNIIDTLNKLKTGTTRLTEPQLNQYIDLIWQLRFELTRNNDQRNFNQQEFTTRLQPRIQNFVNGLPNIGQNLRQNLIHLLTQLGSSYLFSMRHQPLEPRIPEILHPPRPTMSSTTTIYTVDNIMSNNSPTTSIATSKRKRSSSESVESKKNKQGGSNTITYKGRSYKVHVGSRGGHYILVQQQKIYV